MNIPLEVIHTSDMNGCPRFTALRRLGMTEPKGTRALYRGNLFHAAVRLFHENKQYDRDGVDAAMHRGLFVAEQHMIDEGRPLTEAVNKAKLEIAQEIAELLEAYCNRFAHELSTWTLIGCECPINLTLQGHKFGSHIDLIWRDEEERLHVWDWKTGQDEPWRGYLARNKQFVLYALTAKLGQIQIGDNWVEFDEWAKMSWIHINNLAAYKRGGARKDGSTYIKDEEKPIDTIVREVRFLEQRAGDMVTELVEVAKMMKAGYFPRQPDPIGCRICEGAEFCSRFDMPALDLHGDDQ